MEEWYYDFLFDQHPSLENIVRVGRVYCFKFDEFSDDDWKTLTSCFSELPGWVGRGVTTLTQLIPYWFGKELEDIYGGTNNLIYLSASMEPTGLQVDGNIELDDWINWTEDFERRTMLLPHYSP